MRMKKRFFAQTAKFIILFFIISCNGIVLADHKAHSNRSFWQAIAGKPINNRIYLGMWSYHFRKKARHDDDSNNLGVSLVHKGYYAAAFKNSYNDLTISAGIQRSWCECPIRKNFDFILGYRLGLIYGYDERMDKTAGRMKVFPYILPFADLQYKKVGIEFQTFIYVVTASFYFNFG